MPHIALSAELPGITSLFAFRPETAVPLQMLAETLLRAPGSLSRGQRELIASYVSSLNACEFCCGSHAAFASAQLSGGRPAVDAVLSAGPGGADSAKMTALLAIAALVQRSGRAVTPGAVARARQAGATDVEIHDTVLIAAAFCMFNRYVDGLATTVPDGADAYDAMAAQVVQHGYVRSLSSQAGGSAAESGPAMAPHRVMPPKRGTRLLLVAWLAVATISVAACGDAKAGHAQGGNVVVAAQRAGRLDVFKAGSLKRTASWSVGGDPHVVVLDRGGKTLWVSAPKAKLLRAFDAHTGRLLASLAMDAPDGLALTPDGKTLLVTEGIMAGRPGHIAYVDTHARRVLTRVAVGQAPHAIAITPDGATAYVSDQYSGDVSIVDVPGRKRVGTLPAPGVPYQLTIANGRLYVSRLYAGVVSVFDTARGMQVAAYQLDKGLSQLVVSPDGRRLFVAEKGLAFLAGYPGGNIGSSVAVIDLQTGASFPVRVPPGPDALLISGNRMYVTSLGSANISSINLTTFHVSTVGTSEYPTGLAAVA